MDSKFWFGIVAACILSVLATLWGVVSFAGEAYVRDIAETTHKDNESVSADEVEEIKEDIAAMRATLDQSLEVQRALLNAILED